MPEAKPLRFSVDSLTVGDMEDIEEGTGMSFDDLIELLTKRGEQEEERPSFIGIPLKVLKVLVWVIHRADNPDFTIEDARKIKVSELELVMSEPDPTGPAGGGSSSPSATSGS